MYMYMFMCGHIGMAYLSKKSQIKQKYICYFTYELFIIQNIFVGKCLINVNWLLGD